MIFSVLVIIIAVLVFKFRALNLFYGLSDAFTEPVWPAKSLFATFMLALPLNYCESSKNWKKQTA